MPTEACFENYFISGSKTEAGQDRVLAVSPMSLAAYQSLLQKAKSKGSEKLIDAYEGNKDFTNFRKRDFKELMEEVGCPGMTPYACRHTFSTLAVRNGVKPEILRRMMGHSDIKVTDKYYTHLDKDDILAEITKIGESFTVTSKLQANKNGSIQTPQKSS